MEVAAVGHPRTKERQQLLPFRVRDEGMFNSPDMPVSDAHANIAAGNDGPEYTHTYMTEVMDARGIDAADLDSEDEEDFFIETESYPESIDDVGGLYYHNATEDPGSISAVVPSARGLQH
ncbi:MAG: hypothetical protein LC679_06625, partial [Intrasporangiaceae bacterium]|nr:hypothetical protein [Intrasporangiaceae bacterium]